MRRIIALSINDLKNISRDSMLIMLILYPFFTGLIIRFIVPPLSDWLLSEHDFNLLPYYPMIEAIIILMNAILFGVIVSFIIIDENDDNIYQALKVTPLPQIHYLAYRFMFPCILSFLFTYVIVAIAGLGGVKFLALTMIALLVCLETALIALFIASFAKNKVEAMAYTKGMMFIILSPAIIYLLDGNWHLFFTIIPTYWPIKTFYVAKEFGYSVWQFWAYLFAGIVWHLFLIYLLTVKFRRKIY